MPLAILLNKQLGALTKGARRLSSWGSIADRFEHMVDRQRSAYLVHWFGKDLPVRGLALVVTIVNMAALRARYQAVGGGRSRARAEGPGPGEPLLGLTGMLVGALSLPLNLAIVGGAVSHFMAGAATKAGLILNFLTGGLLGGPLTLAAGTVGGAIGIAKYGRAGFGVLDAVSELVAALQRLYAQITGPRDKVRNPLLREALIVADGVTLLISRMFGLFAFLVTCLGPELVRMKVQMLATIAFAKELWGVVKFGITSMLQIVKQLVVNPGSVPDVLARVIRRMTAALVHAGSGIVRLGRTFTFQMKAFGAWQKFVLADWWNATGSPILRASVTEHPFVVVMTKFGLVIGPLVSAIKRWIPEDEPGVKTWIKKKGLAAYLWVKDAPDGAPSFNTPVSLSTDLRSADKIEGAIRGALGQPRLPLAHPHAYKDRHKHWHAIHRPPSVFLGEQAAVRAHAQRAEPRRHAVIDYLELAARMMGPQAAEFARDRATALAEADAKLPATVAHPVKDLEQPRRLRPRIKVLRIRGEGLSPDDVRAWTGDLRKQLEATAYAVPAGG